jgi:carboxyl-terminal processing protease
MSDYKRPTRRISFLLTVAILSVILISYSFCQRENKDEIIVQLVMKTLGTTHFSPLDIDDAFSEKVYNLYLKKLDYNKRFFTKEDLKKLEVYKNQIDDEIKANNLDFYKDANTIYYKNLDKVQAFYTEILSHPFTFDSNEVFETDVDKIDYPKDDAALKDIWQKSLKYQVLARVTDMLEHQEKARKLAHSKDNLLPENSSTLKERNQDNNPDAEDSETQDSLKADTAHVATFAEMELKAREKIKKLNDDLFKRIKQTSETDRFAMYINSIANVFDPHTQYFSPKQQEDFNLNMTGQLEGIGAQLSETSEGYVKVVDIVPGSASWLQGELKVNDLILKVTQENKEPVDIQDMRIDDVVKLIRGKKGTRVTLKVKKVNGGIKDITITRDVVILKEKYAKSAIVDGPDGKIGYIYLPQFYANFDQTETGRSCSEDVEKEINKLKKENVTGIILDLRYNGGGSLRDAVRMAGLFITKGPIVQVKYKSREPNILEDPDPLIHYAGPLVIMVNTYSASASEILAAAMQDYHRAIIIGTNTFGKGTVQTEIQLDDRVTGPYQSMAPFGTVLVTIQKFYRINGGSTQLKGVTPDIILPDPYSELELGEREQEYCLPWNKVNPATYSTWTGLPKFEQVVQKENANIASNPDFKVIKDETVELKKQKNQTLVSLNLEKYKKQDEDIKAKSKNFENITKKATGLKIYSLSTDIQDLKGDTVTIAGRNTWIKDLSKDIYVKEAVNTISLINNTK